MARKKETKVEPVVEPVVETVVEQQEEQIAKPVEAEQDKKESIYLRETLFGMDEIKAFGLNRDFLCAILKDKFYTLSQAKELICSACK